MWPKDVWGSSMKIAICLYGNVGHNNCASARPARTCEELIHESNIANKDILPTYRNLKNIIDKYEAEVFVHSWSTNKEKEIIDHYKPRKHEILPQANFEVDLEEYGIKGGDISKWDISESTRFGYEGLLPSRQTVDNILKELALLAFRTKSRWWSTKRTLELKKQYEDEQGFRYDFVLLNRFDNKFLTPLPFEKLEKDKIYASKRTGRIDIDYTLFDYWFVGDSHIMDQFGALYDNIHSYSIRPTFACREHIEKVLGKGALITPNWKYQLFR